MSSITELPGALIALLFMNKVGRKTLGYWSLLICSKNITSNEVDSYKMTNGTYFIQLFVYFFTVALVLLMTGSSSVSLHSE